VLSAPLPELTPTVALVPCPDDAACEGAASECAASWSVVDVAAIDLFPIVGGGRPSRDDRKERLLRSREVVLIDRPVGTVEKDLLPLGAVE
jgi:hypothetical protein